MALSNFCWALLGTDEMLQQVMENLLLAVAKELAASNYQRAFVLLYALAVADEEAFCSERADRHCAEFVN